MIRTAFAILFVTATASVAYANVPALAPIAAAEHASSILDLTIVAPRSTADGEPLVVRGHADLAPRHVVPSSDAIRTA